MKWKRRACVEPGFVIFCALMVLLTLVHVRGLAVASLPVSADTPMPTADTVRVHGQIRDMTGNPRQAYVIVSTYQGPDLAQGLSNADGSYQFDVPAQNSYVISVQPIHRVQIGSIEVPTGFLDTWRRVNRGMETDLTADVVVQPGGTLFPDAYDPQGNRMYRDNFPDAESFAVYPLGTMPVHKSLQLQNHQFPVFWGWETVSETLRNPAVILLPSQVTNTFTIWGLWRVPEAGTIMLEMDNGGVGFGVAAGQVITVNVPYEFARTELRKAEQRYAQGSTAGYVFSPTITLWLTQAQATIDTARGQLDGGDRQGAAMTSYQTLSVAIRAKEEITMAIARQDIERYRRLPVTITVVGPDLQPLSNVQVAYRQLNHDFLFGAHWGGDAAWVGDTPETTQFVGNYNIYKGIVKEIGFESVLGPPFEMWEVVQRDWPAWRLENGTILRRLADDGLRSLSPAIWLADFHPISYPSRLKGLSYENVKAEAVNFVTTTLSHYAGKIQWWNLVNEPNLQNDLNFTPDQMLDFTQAVLTAGRVADPQAALAVGLTSPGLERGYMSEAAGTEAPINFIPAYEYLRQMLDYGIRPDAVGVQFYYGAYYPAIDLGTASDLLDAYRDFNIPIYIQELEYPTHEEYPGLVSISTRSGWHAGHTDQTQADWAVALYTLAFSKPHLAGTVWNLAFDRAASEDGRQGDGYLRRDGLTPRPMAYALSDLFRSWTITGIAQTDISGRLHFNGFAGEYLLTLTGSNGAVRQEKIHVREGQTNTFSINFDQNQSLTDNRQSADAILDKVRYAFAWANALGKTSGLAEARQAHSQALASYSAGQYWSATRLDQQALDAIALRVDGDPGDWAGVRPLYSQSDQQGQANGNQLRRFWGTMDNSALYLQFEFSTSAPNRELLFELDANADGILDYHVHTYRRDQYTKFVREDDASTLHHLMWTIDVIYSNTVEIRIPLVDLGNPTRVEVVQYREDQGGGNFSTIPSLGVVAPPFRLHLPVILKDR